MKKEYINPEMEVIQFETEDIMSASGIVYNSQITDPLNAFNNNWGSTNDW